VLTADTDNAWVTIYDRGEQLDGRYAGIADRRALGPVLLRLAARAGTSAVFVPSFGVRCVHGLYAEISGGPSVCVYSIPFDYMGLILQRKVRGWRAE